MGNVYSKSVRKICRIFLACMYLFESLIKTSNVNICLLATEVGLSFESHEGERILLRILEPGL